MVKVPSKFIKSIGVVLEIEVEKLLCCCYFACKIKSFDSGVASICICIYDFQAISGIFCLTFTKTPIK